MLSNKILYVSESSMASKAANSIQVKSMCAAFVESGFEVDLLCRNKSNNQISGINMIEGPKGLYFYRIWTVYKILRVGYNKSYHCIYGRSYVAQLIVTLLGIRSYLELHTNEKSIFLKKLIFYLSQKKNLIFVLISTPLLKDMGLSKYNYIIAHDGHSNKNDFSPPEIREKQKLNVGYFGKLSERKGIEILKLLDQQDKLNINLHIYSPDTKKYSNFSSKVFLEYIDHEYVLGKMNSMDVLLLPIKAVQFRDYSRYTSPLKLFEYASVGRAIIISDVPSMRDMCFPNGIFVCKKDVDWISVLKDIQEQNIYNDISILSGIKKWSNDYLWTIRVKNILKHDFS